MQMKNTSLVLVAVAFLADGLSGSLMAETSGTKTSKPSDQGGKAKETEIIILLQPTTKSAANPNNAKPCVGKDCPQKSR
jgi:hypothetical protein